MLRHTIRKGIPSNVGIVHLISQGSIHSARDEFRSGVPDFAVNMRLSILIEM